MILDAAFSRAEARALRDDDRPRSASDEVRRDARRQTPTDRQVPLAGVGGRAD
jgi:hypothetical protein